MAEKQDAAPAKYFQEVFEICHPFMSAADCKDTSLAGLEKFGLKIGAGVSLLTNLQREQLMEVFAREVVGCQNPLLFGFSHSGLRGIANRFSEKNPEITRRLIELSYGTCGPTIQKREANIISAYLDALDMEPKPL